MTTIRPLSTEERQALIAKANNPITLTGALLMAALCAAISIGILYVVDRFLGLLSPYFLLFFNYHCCLACLQHSLLPEIMSQFFTTPYRDDLAGGVAAVTRFHATKAIRVEELEDAGGGYFLHLKDGTPFFCVVSICLILKRTRSFLFRV
jgi:hypothetical protein